MHTQEYEYERPVVLHDLRIDRVHNHVNPARVSEDLQMDGVRAIVVCWLDVRYHGCDGDAEGHKFFRDFLSCTDETFGNDNENECQEPETLHGPERILE